MFRLCFFSSMVSLFIPVMAAANPPKVAVDIAPVHSLVAQVMDGIGSPDLLIQAEASPHSYSLRPSEAEALSQAAVVFWIGEGLTPWLENSLENLAGSATKVEMLEIEGTTVHDYREGASFEAHEHHDEHHDEASKSEEHDDDEHHDEEHHDEEHHDEASRSEEHHDEEHHDEEHEGEEHADGHHHDGHDPHAWLDPVNAKIWVNEIARVLSEQDAANAETYQQNAETAVAKLDELTASIQQQSETLEGIKFIVFHDAYQYFEQRFGVVASGAISLGDASDPSPARIEEIQNTVMELGVTCVFTEPQYNPNMVNTVFEGTSVSTIGVMDPLGASIEVGKNHYPMLLNAMITSLSQCKS